MSSQKTGQAAIPAISADIVEQYLRDNPDFFLARDDLLMELTVPHATGSAISMVEHQVGLLREQNGRYRRQLHSLVQIARTNDELIGRLQQLTLKLLDSSALEDTLLAVEKSLKEDFHADAAALRLFIDPGQPMPDRSLFEFLHVDVMPEAPIRDDLRALLSAGAPVCGRFDRARFGYLFAPGAEDKIASVALLPLGAAASSGKDEISGLLAIGSDNDDRFTPGMGTTYLKHLSELIGRKIAPRLRAGPPV